LRPLGRTLSLVSVQASIWPINRSRIVIGSARADPNEAGEGRDDDIAII
jgi:hypothetical protein